MFIKKYIYILLVFLFYEISYSQESDTSEVEGTGREMYTSLDLSFSNDKGNTDYLSLYYGFDFTLIGDAGPLTDTEFLISFYRSDDQLDGEPFTDEQSLTLKFDIWANQRFSPFLFAQQTFDNTIGLNGRLNYGLGAKFGFLKWFSLSYAFLAESEDYTPYDIVEYGDSTRISYWGYSDSMFIGEYSYDSTVINSDDYYYYDMFYDTWDAAYWTGNFDVNGDSVFTFYNYDSTLINGYWTYSGDSTETDHYYEYTDSTTTPTGGKQNFFRHSIRPKFKFKFFDENLIFDYRFYYKPRVDDWEDYLLEHELKVSIATFYELLTIDLNYTNKYNSRYDILNGGQRIINPLTGTPFKERDESIILGISFSF